MTQCPYLSSLKLLILLLPLLLSALPLNVYAASGDRSCFWRTCHTVTVDHLPRVAAVIDAAVTPLAESDDGGGSRSIVLHQCQPSNNFADKCHLTEFTSEPDGVQNFTMRGAQLAKAQLSDLCQFRWLAGLDLSENSIEQLETAGLPQGCLTHLRWLSLRANALREADLSEFLRLPALEKLDLSENPQLESIYLSRQPGTDTALKVIMAAKCRIKQVDISLVRLPSLQDLDLSYNQLSRLTNRLDWRWSLAEVHEIEAERNKRRARDSHYYARLSVQLVQNQIGPEAFDRQTLWGLPVPDLVTETERVVNQLKLYRDAFQSFLYIDNIGSTIACDCNLLHAWNYLRIVHRDPAEFAKRNALSLAYWLRLPCDTSGGGRLARRTLATLSATELTCVRSDGCPAGCACVERVSPSELVVDCRSAGLSTIPDRLPPSVHPVRYVLLLSDNRIRDITAPPGADRVQDLDLSRNLITEAANFGPLSAFKHLHSLNLTGNPMRQIPPGLLEFGKQGSLLPRLRLGGDGDRFGGLRCDCGLFEPNAWDRLRALLRQDGLRQLRCLAASNQPPVPLEEFRQRHCSRSQQQFNTTSIVYRERQEVFGPPAALLWIGAGCAALFLAVAIVTAVVVVLHCRSGGIVVSKAQRQQQQRRQQQQQQFVQHTQFRPAMGVTAFGGASPDFLPPPGYASNSSPYDTAAVAATSVSPRYATSQQLLPPPPPPAPGLPHYTATSSFRPRFRSRSASGSDDCSSSCSSSGVGGGGCDGGGRGASAGGGSDPVVSALAQRQHVVHTRGHQCSNPHNHPRVPSHVHPFARAHGHSRARHQHRGCGYGGSIGQPLPQFQFERELLLPPPLPPRTHQNPVAALVTDV